MAFKSEDEPDAAVSDFIDDYAERRPRGRVTGVHIALGIVALVALVQAGLIGWWYKAGRFSAQPEFGTVTVDSNVAGAPVAIDGTPRGVTPYQVVLAPGAHRVDVGADADVKTQTVNVTAGGQSSVHVELTPAAPPAAATPTGGLQISTEPGGARVWVDGQVRGVAPVAVRDLTPGPHAVTVTGPNGTVNRTVTVQEGVVSSLIIAMNGSSEFASGWLAITAPISAQILQGGTLLGTTDTPRIMLSAGSHDIELQNASLGYTAKRKVQITAGKTTTLNLDVPRGTLHVNALPWAEVWIDGQRAGETPLGNVSLPIGNHELVFRHPELGEQKKTVVVSAGAPVRVGVDLRK
jgi:hypothetical protein